MKKHIKYNLTIFCLICSLGFAAVTSNISIYFSPKDKCDEILINELLNAKQEVNIAIYSLTKLNIGEAIAKLKKRGVKIRVVVDNQQAGGKYSLDEYLIAQQIPLLRDKHSGLMHNKFAVIDGQVVLTGSYNWTNGATYKNDENLIIIRSLEAAQRFNTEFSRLWQENQ